MFDCGRNERDDEAAELVWPADVPAADDELLVDRLLTAAATAAAAADTACAADILECLLPLFRLLFDAFVLLAKLLDDDDDDDAMLVLSDDDEL